jgi:hypothetical protein
MDECWIVDGDRAYQPGNPEQVIAVAELEARPMARTRFPGRIVRVIVDPPKALAPLIIRWGGSASSDRLRRCARCSKCGRLGASLTHPSWEGLDTGFAAFPVEHL